MRSPIKRNPVRGEPDAFWIAVVGAAMILLSVLVGWLTMPLVGAVVFVVVALAATAGYLRTPDPGRRRPLWEAAREAHPRPGRPGRRRVLVIANEVLAGDELRGKILGPNGSTVELDVLAPVLTSRVHFATTDIDEEREHASTRLERSLAWARSQGIPARGEVGDSDPTTALEDELRDFGADEVIVFTGTDAAERWQEQEELDRLREELEVPVMQVSAS